MRPHPIVVAFDPSEDQPFHLLATQLRQRQRVDQFLLERRKERFHPRVVIAAAHCAHALPRSVCLQAVSEQTARVLAPVIAVHDHILRSAVPANG